MPGVSPVTTPVDAPTDTLESSDDHVPPSLPLMLRVMVLPAQTEVGPLIVGPVDTVTVAVAMQPVGIM